MYDSLLQELASGPVFSHLDYARNLSAAIGMALGGGRATTSVSAITVRLEAGWRWRCCSATTWRLRSIESSLAKSSADVCECVCAVTGRHRRPGAAVLCVPSVDGGDGNGARLLHWRRGSVVCHCSTTRLCLLELISAGVRCLDKHSVLFSSPASWYRAGPCMLVTADFRVIGPATLVVRVC